MRPLAFAATLVALAGCSLPYVDTSFAAAPKPQHMAEGGDRAVNDKKGEHVPVDPSAATNATAIDSPDADAPGGVRTASAFPPTTQPTGRPSVMVNAVPEEGHPSHATVEGE